MTSSSSSQSRPFEGRVAVVTGAAHGLGRSYACLLARLGASVVVNDTGGATDGSGGDPGPALAVVEDIHAEGGRAVADTNTVATAEGGEGIVGTALDAFGTLDILVNNAGITRNSSFSRMTADMFDAVLDVHLRGAFHTTKAVWPHMRERRYGRILNTTSNAGLLGVPGGANYGSAKAGLVGLTRVLAVEGAGSGIRVNAIAPIAATRLTDGLAIDGWTPEVLDPDLVAPVAAWLVHEDCPVTGEIYSAGGGRVARYFIGLTDGYFSSDLDFDQILAHVDTIRSLDSYTVPDGPTDEFAALTALLGEG